MPPRRRKRDGDGSKWLPSDAVSDILMRLDVKTLSRFRCVCKPWNQEISSPSFINKHRRQSISRGLLDLLFINFGQKQPEEEEEEEDDNYDRDNKDKQQWFWAFTIMNPADHVYMELERTVGAADKPDNIISSSTVYIDAKRESGTMLFCLPVTCDLLCFTTIGRIEVCNPRTGKVQTLPELAIDFWGEHFNIVFGYVDSRRQYILVALFYKKLEKTLVRKAASKFCFSSSEEEDECGFDSTGSSSSSSNISSSSWEEIVDHCPLPSIPRKGEGILINNSVCWLVKYLVAPKIRIVSLDLDNDKFKNISCPVFPDYVSVTLIDLKGTLSLAGVTDIISLPKSIDIWVFNEFESSCSWLLKYSINLHPMRKELPKLPYICPKSSKEGELIVDSAIPGKHFVCNPEERSIKTVINPCPSTLLHSYIKNVGFYWESFFSF